MRLSLQRFAVPAALLSLAGSAVHAETVMDQLRRHTPAATPQELQKAQAFMTQVSNGVAAKPTAMAKLDTLLNNWRPALKAINFGYSPDSVKWQDVLLGRRTATDCGQLCSIFQACAAEFGIAVTKVTKDAATMQVTGGKKAEYFMTGGPLASLVDGTKGFIDGNRFLFENHTWLEYTDTTGKVYVFDALFGSSVEKRAGHEFWEGWTPLRTTPEGVDGNKQPYLSVTIDGTKYYSGIFTAALPFAQRWTKVKPK
jgi:hypothetical protein